METLPITQCQVALGRTIIADQHGKRCSDLVRALAGHLGIHDYATVELLCDGARIHDIGKSWIPDWIVLKAGKLKPEEYERVKLHPAAGAEFLKEIGVNGGIRDIVLCHHERWDGSGYPSQLKGRAIPMLARIVSVADTYDALMNARNYPRYDARGVPLPNGGQFGHEQAMDIIAQSSGLAFDPKVVKAFVKMKDKEFR